MKRKKPFAYVSAATGTDFDDILNYCQSIFDAGFYPICPTLYMDMILAESYKEENEATTAVHRHLLRHSNMLIVCGGDMDEQVEADIAWAKQMNIPATTLTGILEIECLSPPDIYD